jgi:hypothetical protein
MIARIKQEARLLWAFWSVRLAAVAGMAAAYIVSDPGAITGLLVYVPEGVRPAIAPIIGFLVFALPTLARRLPQPKLHRGDK